MFICTNMRKYNVIFLFLSLEEQVYVFQRRRDASSISCEVENKQSREQRAALPFTEVTIRASLLKLQFFLLFSDSMANFGQNITLIHIFWDKMLNFAVFLLCSWFSYIAATAMMGRQYTSLPVSWVKQKWRMSPWGFSGLPWVVRDFKHSSLKNGPDDLMRSLATWAVLWFNDSLKNLTNLQHHLIL